MNTSATGSFYRQQQLEQQVAQEQQRLEEAREKRRLLLSSSRSSGATTPIEPAASDISLLATPPPRAQSTLSLSKTSPSMAARFFASLFSNNRRSSTGAASGGAAQQEFDAAFVIGLEVEVEMWNHRHAIIEAEAELRCDILFSFFAESPATVAERLEERRAAAFLSGAASTAILELLSQKGSKRKKLTDEDLDGVLGEEHVISLLREFAKVKDDEVAAMRAQLTEATALAAAKEAALQKEVSAQNEKIDREMWLLSEVESQRALAERQQDQLRAVLTEKASLEQQIISMSRQYEDELAGAIHQLNLEKERQDGTKVTLVAAYKAAEERALEHLRMQNLQIRRNLEEELQRAKRQCEQVAKENERMKTVYEECLSAKTMLQAELMELQEIRSAAICEANRRVAHVEERAAKERMASQRRVKELERLVAERDYLLQIASAPSMPVPSPTISPQPGASVGRASTAKATAATTAASGSLAAYLENFQRNPPPSAAPSSLYR